MFANGVGRGTPAATIVVGNITNNILGVSAGGDTAIFTSATGITVTLNDTGAVIVAHDG